MERDERLGNDSGISSAYTPGSDGFQTSSPGSSDQNSRDSEPSTATIQPQTYSSPTNYYNTPTTLDTRYTNGAYHPYLSTNYENHMQITTTQSTPNTPLTPILTSVSDETKSSPTHDRQTPEEHSESEESDQYYKNDDRHDSLSEQHSPKGSEHNSLLEDDKSDYEGEEDEANLRTPRVNSHGKVKIFKCKQCEFVAVTKMDFWEHTRGHIKVEKLLTCPKCPFVTEYKHHLEYHLRNHFGSKPFKCDKCNYSCVNKSMLNSHLKSHSNVYQYRCSDCAYATKYCHSLKLHLRKYGHKPAMVLNPDGSPNPLPIIDVYGTRRGPKQRHNNSSEKNAKNDVPLPEKSPPVQQTQQQVMPSHSIFPASHFMLQPNQSAMPLPMPFPFGQLLNAFQGNIPNPLAFPSNNNNNNIDKSDMIHNDSEMENSQSPHLQTCDHCDYTASNKDDLNTHLINAHEPLTPKLEIISDDEEMPAEDAQPSSADTSEALDLSRPDAVHTPSTTEMSVLQTPTTPTTKNRRKGRAFKLGHAALQLQHTTVMCDEENTKMDEPQTDTKSIAEESSEEDEPAKIVEKKVRSKTPPTTAPVVEAPKKDLTFSCQYCDIVFKDVVMYTMHMGYHGYRDPFTCNMCGEQTADKLAFFLHIARTSHC